MEKLFQKSLQMIKVLDIKSEKEYSKLLKNYLIMSSQNLMYRCDTNNFDKVISFAKVLQ